MIQDWFARFGYKCCNRLWKLKGRLDKKPEHLKQHNDIIQDQLKKEVVEVVEEKPSDEKCFEGGMMHLPHCEVTCEDKSSTELQIAYEASAKGKNGVSLNYCLYKGLYMRPTLYNLFLKSQTHAIAFTTNIIYRYQQRNVT